MTFIPGSTEKITWSFIDDIKTSTTRTWTFTPSDGRPQVNLALIVGDGDVLPLISSYELAVEKPATLVLKNVNLTYDGTYGFSLSPGGSSSEVVVYIAGKCFIIYICKLEPFIFTTTVNALKTPRAFNKF